MKAVSPTLLLTCCCACILSCVNSHPETKTLLTNKNCTIQKSSPIEVIPGRPEALTNVNLTNKYSVSYNNSNASVGLTRYGASNARPYIVVNAELGKSIAVTINDTCKYNIIVKVVSSCPLGFRFNKANKTCSCNSFDSSITKCDGYSFEMSVGYCTTIENVNTSLSQQILARCPFSNLYNGVYITFPTTSTSKSFCSQFHRKNRLCSECIDDHGISIYSDTFQCTNCTRNHRGQLASYLAIELVPTTIFFLVILYFHIHITSGPANGFIFFAQIIITPFEATFMRYILNLFFYALDDRYVADYMYDALTIPYSIWNLDFYRIFGSNICFSKELRAIDILTLRYISVVYPFFLLVLCYIVIELQAMNFRPVLWMLKIVCFPCMRWQRVWKAKISIVDTFAAYVLLSYTKTMYISFYLLSKTEVEGGSGNVLSFDPRIEAYTKEHLQYVGLPFFMILFFGLFPIVLLILYQFKYFHGCLEKLRLKRPAMEQFVLAFQGCYKDGENGTQDRRFFAGLYFVFRLFLVIVITLVRDTTTILASVMISCIIFMFVCAIAQPYKKAKYNILDCFFFALLAAVSGQQYYMYTNSLVTGEQSRGTLAVYFLVYIPLIYIMIYVGYWLFLCIKNRESNPYTLTLNNNEDDNRNSLNVERPNLTNRPVNINISPRRSITHTEVSIAELSQDDYSDENQARQGNETTPLLFKRREMKIISQHAATSSQEYYLPT